MPTWPPWWEWELELGPHLFKRMADRRFMRLLLDTHAWLWMSASPERFGKRALKILESADNELLLSSASTWEISTKYALGRIEFPSPPSRILPEMMRETAVTARSIAHDHAIRAGSLPAVHNDPFDRMLIAQAQAEGLPILTSDRVFASYDVRIVSTAS